MSLSHSHSRSHPLKPSTPILSMCSYFPHPLNVPSRSYSLTFSYTLTPLHIPSLSHPLSHPFLPYPFSSPTPLTYFRDSTKVSFTSTSAHTQATYIPNMTYSTNSETFTGYSSALQYCLQRMLESYTSFGSFLH